MGEACEMTGHGKDFRPKVSIITVTYNAADLLEQTILSIAGQSYDKVEFVIIDGGSNDRTPDILEANAEIIDTCISEPDDGIYDAMNKGLAAASGEYVLFLNAGDYFCSESSLEDIFRGAGTPVDVLYGDIQLVTTEGTSRHHKALPFTHDNLLQSGTGVLCHQAILVRREIAPMYDIRYTYKGELNWYFDIFKNRPDLTWYHYQEPLVYYFLGGKGYQNFIRNRFEWYCLLVRRFGCKSVFNKKFLKFIYTDFSNRYKILRSLVP